MKEVNKITMNEDVAFELLKSKKEDGYDIVKRRFDAFKAHLEATTVGSQEQKHQLEQEIKTLDDAFNSVANYYKKPWGEVPPGCEIPKGLTATGITNTAAYLTWVAVSGASSYNLQWGPAANPAANTVSGLTAPRYALRGLTLGTDYAFQVQAVCSAVNSAYSASSGFTTTADQEHSPEKRWVRFIKLLFHFRKKAVIFALIILALVALTFAIKKYWFPDIKPEPAPASKPIDSTLLVQLLNTPFERRSDAWKDSLSSLVPNADSCAFYLEDVRMGSLANVISRMKKNDWPFTGLLLYETYKIDDDKRKSILVMKHSRPNNTDSTFEIVPGVSKIFVEAQIKDLVDRFTDRVRVLSNMAMTDTKSNYETIKSNDGTTPNFKEACDNIKKDIYKLFISDTVSIESILSKGLAPVSEPLNDYLSRIFSKSERTQSIIDISVEEATKYEIRELKTKKDGSMVGVVDVVFSYKRLQPEANHTNGEVPQLKLEYSDVTLKTIEVHLVKDHFASSDGSKEGYRVCLGKIKAIEIFNSN